MGVDVTDFGAVGDGVHDDTQVFRDAIAACPDNHAIFIPNGRYRITEQIALEPGDNSYFVLRGEGLGWSTATTDGKTKVELELTHDYGLKVFLRLVQP